MAKDIADLHTKTGDVPYLCYLPEGQKVTNIDQLYIRITTKMEIIWG
jgi:hypothetical protein